MSRGRPHWQPVVAAKPVSSSARFSLEPPQPAPLPCIRPSRGSSVACRQPQLSPRLGANNLPAAATRPSEIPDVQPHRPDRPRSRVVGPPHPHLRTSATLGLSAQGECPQPRSDFAPLLRDTHRGMQPCISSLHGLQSGRRLIFIFRLPTPNFRCVFAFAFDTFSAVPCGLSGTSS